MHHVFKNMQKFFKLQRKFVESMHIGDEKLIQSFFHLNTGNTCQNYLMYLNILTLTKKL